jgi:hypothetical protein
MPGIIDRPSGWVGHGGQPAVGVRPSLKSEIRIRLPSTS